MTRRDLGEERGNKDEVVNREHFYRYKSRDTHTETHANRNTHTGARICTHRIMNDGVLSLSGGVSVTKRPSASTF